MSREIIDLTESPPPPEPIVIRSDADDNELAQGEIEARRPRKKRRKRVPNEDGKLDEGSAQASRSHSREKHADRENNVPSHQRPSSPERRQRSLSPQPRDKFADIFFVDVVPVQVPVSAKSTLSAHGRQHTPMGGDIGHSKLLLPEHVSVFGAGDNGEGPVEIIGPTPNSGDEDEDFIEYLDYDDRNKVGLLVLPCNSPADGRNLGPRAVL
jgi:protein AIR1/2